jgi:hypothetical protein
LDPADMVAGRAARFVVERDELVSAPVDAVHALIVYDDIGTAHGEARATLVAIGTRQV